VVPEAPMVVMVPVAVVPIEASEAVEVAPEASMSTVRVGRVRNKPQPCGDEDEDTQEPHRG
jgi:hypothetical protein